MTCMKAQSLITAFINDELDIDELEDLSCIYSPVKNAGKS